jgi:hypothetical protein
VPSRSTASSSRKNLQLIISDCSTIAAAVGMQTVSTPHVQQRHSLAQLLAALVLAYAAAASGQQPASNGYISPPSTLPNFNPAAWNQAYKLLLRNLPAQYSSSEVLHSLTFPNAMLSTVQMPQECASEGFDTVAAAAVALVSTAPAPNSSTTESQQPHSTHDTTCWCCHMDRLPQLP